MDAVKFQKKIKHKRIERALRKNLKKKKLFQNKIIKKIEK